MKIEKLHWDSIFFEYPIGKIEIKELHIEQYDDFMANIYKSGMKLIYVFPLDQISKNTLTANKIPLIDTKVIFEKKDNFIIRNIENIKSYDNTEKYLTIEKLAFLSGKFSRFKKDINFTKNEFHKLYTEWIKKSICKEIATDVLVFKDADRIIGFVSYKIDQSNNIIIGLIAVDTDTQSKGIGKTLMQSIENIAVQNNINKIFVSTQLDNKQAMAFYQSNGYKIKEQKEIYHLWM